MNLFFRAFKCRNRNFIRRFFTTYIRPIVENCTTVWSPHLLKDIQLLESVQRKFTKRIPGLKNLPYGERLSILNLDTLECRRLCNDLVMCYKMLHGHVNIDYADFFNFCADGLTRNRHNQRLVIEKSRLDCRKFGFSNRVVQPWNSLSQEAVDSRSIHVFKDHLRNFDFSRFLKYKCEF